MDYRAFFYQVSFKLCAKRYLAMVCCRTKTVAVLFHEDQSRQSWERTELSKLDETRMFVSCLGSDFCCIDVVVLVNLGPYSIPVGTDLPYCCGAMPLV